MRLLLKLKKHLAFWFSRPIDKETIEALMDVIAVNYKKSQRFVKNVIFVYPSELSKCLKITYHKYFDPTLIAGLNPSALAGNIVDEGVEASIKKHQKTVKKIYLIHKYPVHYSIKVEDKVVVLSGTIDFVANNAIIEIKSTNSPKLDLVDADKYQAGFYAKALSIEYKKPMKAFLVYIYRKLYLKKVYELSQKDIDEGFRYIVDRALKLYRHLRDKQEPDPSPGYWCSGCPLLDKCEHGQDFIKYVVKKDPKTYIEKQKEDRERFIKAYKKLFDQLPF